MDKSETYIKMCEQAEEIQKGHKLEKGDSTWAVSKGFPIWKTVWLPRQDQLQEMISLDLSMKIRANGFLSIMSITLNESWEQTWLKLVMAVKFNKYWDGITWVAITT